MFNLFVHNLHESASLPFAHSPKAIREAKFRRYLNVSTKLERQVQHIMSQRNLRNDFGSFPIKYTDTQFTERDNQMFEAWYTSNNPQVGEMYIAALQQGWSFKQGWKEDQAAVLCTATCVDDKHARYGYCVTSWGDDPVETIFMTVFKLMVLYADRPLPEQGQRGRRG